MKHKLFWAALVALIVLHHDWWFWDDGRLVFGFLPAGLAYQALISLGAAALWAWAVLGVFAGVFEATPEEILAPTSAPSDGDGRA
jgi:hypothetical protein